MTTLTSTWIGGLFRWRAIRLLGTILGIAVTVALLATLFGFFAATKATMTRQAIAGVAVDWQVQLAPGADPAAAIAELQKSPGAAKVFQVGFFDTPGFQTTEGGTVQTTGAGKVLGLQAGYAQAFPAETRSLAGSGKVLLAQQTAANLHAVPGSTVTIQRPGLAPAQVKVDAVVDLPLADSLFQAAGAPAGAAPKAPPDNVLLLPLDQWHTFFDPVAQIAPSAVRMQLHATIPHALPADPNQAYAQVTGEARNYETRLAGSGVVGDNLGARLDAARADALYSQALFLFLGLPGAILAALLTTTLIASGRGGRRRDQALLRLRGASTARVIWLAASEGIAIGIIGAALGVVVASGAVHLTFGRWEFGNGLMASITWAAVAVLVGLALSIALIVIPSWRDARAVTISAARVAVGRGRGLWWERLGVDVLFLLLSAVIYTLAGRGGYQLVLAPEGVPHISVSYTSFLAPLALWIGASLLIVRLVRVFLDRNGRMSVPFIRPAGGRLAPLVGATLSRHRTVVASGVVLVALAVAFATSTSLFNATYQQQSLVDAQLTNGADVTVAGGAAANLASRYDAIAALPGVTSVEKMQHRFAYVGTDLQDLYGINPLTFPRHTRLADAFFVSGTAKDVMARLAGTPDGVLVSPETVIDFQLQPGDLIRLRLQSAQDHQYHVIPFHYAGIAREFPTAPSDSFLVANASYIAAQTKAPSVETLLIGTSQSPATVAKEVRTTLGATSGATVRDIQEQRRITNSSLTAISLRGLTRIELSFAVVLAAASAGLVLALGLEERRRTLAIASALGAKPRQIGAFVWSEAGIMLAGGLAAGGALGWAIAHMLTKLLTHVFDPPPQNMTIPSLYLIIVGLVTIAAVIVAAQAMIRLAHRGVLETIRQL